MDRPGSCRHHVLRAIVLWPLAILGSAGSKDTGAAVFANPVVEAAVRTGSADPSVVFHRGHYYYCRSIGDARIGVARARRLQDIGAAPMTVVFDPPAGTPYGRQLWAPELQRVSGRWYIYFAASDGADAHHRMFALQAATDDPQGAYRFKGRVGAEPDVWAIDGVVLAKRRALYFVWSGWPEATSGFAQGLYIARMRNPWTIAGARHLIAQPDRPWEQAGASLLEGPAVLQRNGRTFLFYSAAASWGDDYALGRLTLAGHDVLNARAWVKHPTPAFGKNTAAGVFGVGHNSFVRSPDGREDWIVYHAMSRPGAGWAGRSVRAQRFGWQPDGTPALGVAVPLGEPLDEPSGTPGFAAAAR